MEITKENLKQYRMLNKNIEILYDEYDRIKNQIESPNRAVERIGTGTTSNQDKTLNALIKLEKLKIMIDEKWDYLIDMRLSIESAMKHLQEHEAFLIRAYYIDPKPMTFEQIAKEMNYTGEHVRRMHVSVIRKMGKVKNAV